MLYVLQGLGWVVAYMTMIFASVQAVILFVDGRWIQGVIALLLSVGIAIFFYSYGKPKKGEKF